MKEKISEMLDDELNDIDHQHLIHKLREDAELRTVWERYHLMRAAIRRELDVMVSPALADRIASDIREESRPGTPFTARIPRMTRYLAGMAVAASVAAVAIINLQPVSPLKTPAVLTAGGAKQENVAAVSADPKQSQQNTLNSYLVEHSQFAPSAGMNGMMSNIRIVGYSGSQPKGDNK